MLRGGVRRFRAGLVVKAFYFRVSNTRIFVGRYLHHTGNMCKISAFLLYKFGRGVWVLLILLVMSIL